MTSPVEKIIDSIIEKSAIKDSNSISVIKTAFEVMDFNAMRSFIGKIDDEILSSDEKDILIKSLTEEIDRMRSYLELSDYEFELSENGKSAYWVVHQGGSEDFYAMEDAIIDAYKHKLSEDEIFNKMTQKP